MKGARKPRDGRGSVLISGLLLSLAVMMVLGAAVDLGHAFIVRRELVAVADDAALTGSQAIDLDALHTGRLALDPSHARSAALQTIVDTGDVTAQASADDMRITVKVQRRFSTILLGIVGLRRLAVSASATAAPRRP
jgi:Flp pilus assembly protein TadG